MIFETHSPKGQIAPYIESIFHFKNFVPDHSIERVVPTGHLFLIFELDGYVRHTYDNETLKPNAEYREAWISGMHRNYLSISAHKDSEMFVVQFKPFGGHPFIHQSIETLNERVVQASEVLGNEILQLRNSLLSGVTSLEKFEAAEQWLEQRFDPAKCPPQELIAFLKKLQEAPASKYQEIVREYGQSQKHLIDQCKKYIGLTPKYYQRILRFNEILAQIQNKDKISWPQIAYQCGYADQSHFIKEFRHFSGFNPQEFIGHEFNQEEANFFPLDREG